MSKIGRIASNERIPMNLFFNRTPFFATVELQELNKKIKKDQPIQYKSRLYTFETYGSRLSHSIDYPLLALIIKYWINNRKRTGKEQDKIRIHLSDINEVIKVVCSNGKKAETQDKIKSSLLRLCSAIVCFSSPNKVLNEMTPVLSSANLDYKNKWVDVEVSQFLITLYDLSGIDIGDYYYMNIEKIVAAPSENAKALMKYFMKQRDDYIDFKLTKLEEILGYQFKEKPIAVSVIRARVKKALDILVAAKFLTTYETRKNNMKKLRSWDEIRIIPTTLCEDLEEATEMLLTEDSNLTGINVHYYKKKVKAENAESERIKAENAEEMRIKTEQDTWLDDHINKFMPP